MKMCLWNRLASLNKTNYNLIDVMTNLIQLLYLKSAVKQLDQVDLAAGLRQGVEILVMDVDFPLGVGLGDVGRDDVFIIKLLAPSEPYFSMVPMAVSALMLAFSRFRSASSAGTKVRAE